MEKGRLPLLTDFCPYSFLVLFDFVAQDVQILDAIIEPFEVIAQKLQKPF